MTRPAKDGCWQCVDSLRSVHGLHGYFCRRVQDYRKDGCKSKKKRSGKAEPQMVFFHVGKLAKKYGMTMKAVVLLFKALGLKRWSSGVRKGSIWYWEED